MHERETGDFSKERRLICAKKLLFCLFFSQVCNKFGYFVEAI
jgi:hypothetical protein